MNFRSLAPGFKSIYLLTTLFLVGLSIFVYTQIAQIIEVSYLLNENAKASLELDLVVDNLRDAQSAQREFLVTHDSAYITQFENALKEYPTHLEKIKTLLPKEASQLDHLNEIEAIITRRKVFMYKILELDKTRAVTSADTRPGGLIMDTLRMAVSKVKSIDQGLLLKRDQILDYHNVLTPFLILGLTLISLGVLLISYLKIKERTDEITHKNAELEKINSELESFNYIASHDLQEPLRKILMNANLFLERESGATSSGRSYIEKIHTSASSMRLLIEDLLTFSKLNDQKVAFEKTDLSVLVNEVISDLSETITEKKAVIEVQDLKSLNVIPYQFKQLFTNLISNAVKFSRPEIQTHIIIGSDTLSINSADIKTHSSETLPAEMLITGKKYVHLFVTDNGIGFDPQFREQIFKIFTRLHLKHEYKGTGIGLAIVKKIVENHNGFVTAVSEPGEGSTFHVYIPATD